MDEAMHVIKESMNDTGGVGYFHVRAPHLHTLHSHLVSFSFFVHSLH